jgi:hypothetical protein
MSIKTTKNYVFILLAASVSLWSCKKTSDVIPEPTAPANTTGINVNDAIRVTATVTGSVLDENGVPMPNAAVSSGSSNTTTDAFGNFIFRNISVSQANGSVTVTKAGYFKGVKSFVTSAGRNNYVKIQLIKQNLTATIAAATAATVAVAPNVNIAFPAGAFATASGAAYTGQVRVFATYIDPTASNLPLIVPGDLRGINSSNSEFLLKSYGMVGAEFTDANGAPLRIAAGKTAQINFGIPASMLATAPNSIPLWHFDEVTARWKEEGAAVKNGNAYTATVSKFSFWNCDVPSNFVNLEARFTNSLNNTPLANVLVKITSLANNTFAFDHTNDSGYVSGYVPKNENLRLEVITSTLCASNAIAYTQNIGPYSANVNLGNINVALPTNTYISFSGNVKNCANAAVTNGYVNFLVNNQTTAIACIDGQGNFNCTVLKCNTAATNYAYYAFDATGNTFSQTISATTNNNAVTLPNVSACGNIVNNNGVYITGYIDKNAVLWKNGILTNITNFANNSTQIAYPNDLIVSGNDVYVLYTVADTGYNPIEIKLWKNGVVSTVAPIGTILSDEDLPQMVLKNSTIYCCYDTRVAVSYPNGMFSRYIPKLWNSSTNSTSTIPMGTYTSIKVTGIAVDANADVLISGNAYGDTLGIPYQPLYWRNSVLYSLNLDPNSQDGQVRDMFVSGNDLYLSGKLRDTLQDYTRTVYWKNGNLNIVVTDDISTENISSSIFVDNQDVYLGGSRFVSATSTSACYWKNNVRNDLLIDPDLNNEAFVYDIAVKNSIVYSIGIRWISDNPRPLYYQNNTAIPLAGFTNSQRVGLINIVVQ